MSAQRRRGHPEADVQRAVVAFLRAVLPAGSIVHHSAHEQRGGGARARLAQAVGVGMGVHPGFPDLVVVTGGRVLFLEIKTERGVLSQAQRAVGAALQAQGLPWAVVRSVDDARAVLAALGVRTRLVA